MEDFIEWIEESINESFIFSLSVVLCLAVMLFIFAVMLFIFGVSVVFTYGATLLLPFGYVAYKYFNRNK